MPDDALIKEQIEHLGYAVRVKGDGRVEMTDKYGKTFISNHPENAIAWATEMGPAPEIITFTGMTPDTAEIGAADVTVSFAGENFDEHVRIKWGDAFEPTTLVSPTELTTVVKPSMASIAVEVPVALERNGYETGTLMFAFTEPAAPPLE